MRRQQTRYRSDSIASPSPLGGRKASISAASATASPTRRESLVKPTWQHITPGQLPPKTLDKINGINSDDSDDDGYPKRRPSVIVHQRQQSISQQPLLPEFMTTSSLFQAQQMPHLPSANGFMARLGSSVRLTSSEQQPLLDTGGGGGGVNAGGSGGGGGGGAAAAAAGRAPFVAPPAPGPGNEGASATLCKNAGRALIRMISSGNGPDEDEDFDIMGKVIMLGDSGVGKTSLLIRFRDGRYVPSYFLSTVGIDFRNKVVVVDGTRVKLQIWDTAGQERFRSVTHAYYRDAHALLLLYDVTNKTTYDNIRAWLGEIREYAQEDVVIVLIGNKADCSGSERQVKREDGERLGREHNVPFMETSAKTGLNVELAFTAVARQLKSRGYEHGDDGKFNVHDFVRDNTKARSVCAQCRNM
ncbi:ras-related protein Rab-26 isoform X1 [Drosophila pseudoobscura]|uniref:small monomeric GTPase n=1 Tax=Drosophila pseudoobscura pseudoobscura TaxID=46245 RepID=A0A6I8W8F7_DROPS|nr:ras-related protein Rab-26 isoform X1 [Drosophila pseudoobscura]XP_033239660.1 ras-related protein Rab-26 isoform X1 [Drosophila pseudoobscura]